MPFPRPVKVIQEKFGYRCNIELEIAVQKIKMKFVNFQLMSPAYVTDDIIMGDVKIPAL